MLFLEKNGRIKRGAITQIGFLKTIFSTEEFSESHCYFKCIPKLMAATCVSSSPMLLIEMSSTMKLMTYCQLSSPGSLAFLMLPEQSTTNTMSISHAATCANMT